MAYRMSTTDFLRLIVLSDLGLVYHKPGILAILNRWVLGFSVVGRGQSHEFQKSLTDHPQQQEDQKSSEK